MIDDQSTAMRVSNLAIELVELCESLPATATRERLDAAADDLIRWALGGSNIGAAVQI